MNEPGFRDQPDLILLGGGPISRLRESVLPKLVWAKLCTTLDSHDMGPTPANKRYLIEGTSAPLDLYLIVVGANRGDDLELVPTQLGEVAQLRHLDSITLSTEFPKVLDLLTASYRFNLA